MLALFAKLAVQETPFTPTLITPHNKESILINITSPDLYDIVKIANVFPHNIMFTPARYFLLETPWRIIIPNPNVNSHSL
jgi:hypothetical protein